jgi:predicted DsbA family dithiol-disulfide isomerase
LFAGRRFNIPEMLERLEQTARSLGLPFGERRMSFNSRRAQEAAKWAESHGKADAFHNAVFRAYFVDGKNLHEIETLVTAAESVGLKGGDQMGLFATGPSRRRSIRTGCAPTSWASPRFRPSS